MAVVKLLQAHPGGTGPLVVGETFLDKLEVRALLGKGGHAWVYECFDRFLQRPVAVKVIKTLREAGRDLSRRAQAEAQVLAGMQHPNLVRVIDAGMLGGLVYIVMEKLEGQLLRHALLSLSRLSVRETLNIGIQIADGMQLAHDSGVIHRDLKPENIFIEAGSHVKVLDFGVAKVLGASHVTTQRDLVQGTVFYMSPEQLQGVAVTPASDVFALGTMLFEMLYGHPLTLGGGELPSNEHVAWMQLYRVPPPLESLDPSIPRYVGKLVGRAIVKLPTDRYQTMREFRDAAVAALRRYDRENAPLQHAPRDLSGLPASMRASPPARHSTRLETLETSKQETPPVDGRARRASKPLVWGFAVGVAAVALGLSLRARTSAAPIAAVVPLIVRKPIEDLKPVLLASLSHRALESKKPVEPSTAPLAHVAPSTLPPTPAVIRRAARTITHVGSGLPDESLSKPPVSGALTAAPTRARDTIF